MSQTLHWGEIQQQRLSPADTLYTLTGRRLYVIGDIDGRFRPRSNPYDLYAFGKPLPDDPLAERLQGVWAQPVKGLNGFAYILELDGETWPLQDADTFTQSFASAAFQYRRESLSVERKDFAALNLPILFSTLSLRYEGLQPAPARLHFTANFDLADAWFTHLGPRRNDGETLAVEDGCLVARARLLPDQWAVAVGMAASASVTVQAHLLEGSAGALVCELWLAPGAGVSVTFGVAIESQSGAPGALRTLRHGLANAPALLAEQAARYSDCQASGPRLCSPDPHFNAAFALAQANLRLLEAAPPALGNCFYAGLEMFPFWFSNDGAYSAVGLLASGLKDPTLSHIRLGLATMQAGRVPHQLSPSGKTAFPGNAQETPLWVMSVWDAYRWTGDRNFLAEMYPGAVKGMFEYVLGTIDPDGDGYPSGPGMVEVSGMGEEKLDSAAYTWSALHALARMARVLGDPATERKALDWAENRIQARFDADWWDAGGGTYAMSLKDPGNVRAPVPHWAVVVPLEVGLAEPERAQVTFSTLRAHYLNQWGLKHTAGDDERVWTLPTAALSRAAFRYGETELGFAMLDHIAATLDTGSIGLFHELIPQGACFVQLWSAATFLRGVIEDLLGIEVYAAEHTVRVAPQLPAAWVDAELRGLSFGGHTLHLTLTRLSLKIEHVSGSAALTVRVVLPGVPEQARTVPSGESQVFFVGSPSPH